MGRDDAHRALEAGGAFKLRAVACRRKPGLNDNWDRPFRNGCQADDLLEIWRADTFLRLAGWETLTLIVRNDRVVRIEWFRALGYPA